MKAGVAKVQFLNFTNIFGSGILHTKLMIADNSCTCVVVLHGTTTLQTMDSCSLPVHSLARSFLRWLCEYGLALTHPSEGIGRLWCGSNENGSRAVEGRALTALTWLSFKTVSRLASLTTMVLHLRRFLMCIGPLPSLARPSLHLGPPSLMAPPLATTP